MALFERRAKRVDSVLAIHGGNPVCRRSWPRWPVISFRERFGLLRTLEGGYWWYGDRVKRFESEFAAFQGARHCVTCSSGTTALEIALQAVGVGADDEVIVPAFSFFATASCVVRVGAVPVFVDVDSSWCIDPEAVDAAIGPRTKAIMPVHFAGRVADMSRLQQIAYGHGLKIVEDACHAWGSEWQHRGAGSLGDLGAVSFQISKNITAGEGGAILTRDEELARRCRMIANIGMPDGVPHEHLLIGTNARLTELQAAVLTAQLTRLPAQTRKREQNATILEQGLSQIDGISLQRSDERITRRGYHYFGFEILPEEFGCTRSAFLEAADAEGIPLKTVYPKPLYDQPALDGLIAEQGRGSCPVSERLCRRTGCYLPHWALLASETAMRDVVRATEKIRENVHRLSRG